VLGGITVVLYGMIGLLGAKIWKENGVDFGDPVNLVGLAGGLIAGIGGVTLTMGSNFELSGIALGTIVTIVAYHAARALAPADLRERADAASGTMISLGEREGDYGDADGIDDLYQDRPGGPDLRRR